MRKLSCILIWLLLSACAPKKNIAIEEQEKINTAKINVQLGVAYLQNHNIQRSKEKFLLALQEAPQSAEPWYAMAYFYESTGNLTKAQEFYLKSVELAPEQGEVQNNYGTFLCRTGHVKEAIGHFLLATEDNNYLYTADAFENAGLCSLKLKNFTAANYYFNQALLQDPMRSSSLIELAELNFHLGKYAVARQKLQQFLSMNKATVRSEALSEKLARIVALQNPPHFSKKTLKKLFTAKKSHVRVAYVHRQQLLAKKNSHVVHKQLASKMQRKLLAMNSHHKHLQKSSFHRKYFHPEPTSFL